MGFNGKHLHIFKTQADFNNAYNGSGYTEPWASCVVDTQDCGFDKELPVVTILTKTASGNGYKYTTNPALYDLFPRYSGVDKTLLDVSCSVWFNNVLFTDATKYTYSMSGWSDQWDEYMHLGGTTASTTYKYYVHAEVAEGAGQWNKYAILPDSFGEVGDKIRVRIQQN